MIHMDKRLLTWKNELNLTQQYLRGDHYFYSEHVYALRVWAWAKLLMHIYFELYIKETIYYYLSIYIPWSTLLY